MVARRTKTESVDKSSLSIDLGSEVDEESKRPDKRPWLGKRLWVRLMHLLTGWGRQWMETMPRDDDAPKGLPRWLQGVRGRVIMGIATIVVLVGWLFAIVVIVT